MEGVEKSKFGELEEEDEVGQKPRFELGISHPKAHLILEGSDRHDWGLVKDCLGRINYVPEDAVVVGCWHKYEEGVFWVSLLTPLKALEDTAIRLAAEQAVVRDEDIGRMAKPTTKGKKRKPRAKKEPVVEQDDTLDRLAVLRARLKPKA